MSDDANYDKEMKDIRMQIAMHQSEWYFYFQERNKYLNRLILSYFLVWLVFTALLLFIHINFFVFFVLLNASWFILFLPLFLIRIYKLSSLINLKKEELVIEIWNTKTHKINEIILFTGLEKNFILYYLKKNGLLANNDRH